MTGNLDNSGRPSLGAVAISYNEERDLPGFLENLSGWVDEIVVIDDGSSDRTEEIAAEYGAKVKFLRSPRQAGEYFADQRNKGIDAATSEWLLHMDIDERVTAELAKEILAAIRDPAFDGYRFRRLNHFMHRPMRGGGWQDWNLVHLARRERLRFSGMFHERCEVDSPPGRIGQLASPMVHLNEDCFEKRLSKSGVYAEEVIKQIEDRGKRVGALDLFGRPLVEAVRKYIFKKGFLDGIPGVISALHAATAIFRAHAVVWDRQNRVERAELEKTLADAWTSEGGDKLRQD